MKLKLITLLTTISIIVSFAMPSAYAQPANCITTPTWLNSETIPQNILYSKIINSDILNCDTEADCDNNNIDELQNELQLFIDNQCDNKELQNNVFEKLSEYDCNNIKELSFGELKSISKDVCDNTTQPENDTLEIKKEALPSAIPVEKETIATPTTQPDATPIATQTPKATTTPITTPTAQPDVTPIATPTVQPDTTPITTQTPRSTTTPTVVPTATPAATSTTEPISNTNASSIEKSMVSLVNQDRANAGLPPLKIDNSLTVYARVHSKDMSDNNFFSHTSPTNGGFSERLKNSNITYSSAGENIALYNSIEKAQAGLMSSDGHRANILNKNYTHVGIGIVWNQQKGAYYITQWFARK